MIIDSHAHVYNLPIPAPLSGIREQARSLFEVFVGGRLIPRAHDAQVALRLLPSWARAGAEMLSTLPLSTHLLLESTPEDLLRSMDQNAVAQTLILAHPPVTPNDWVLELAQRYPERLIPVVNVSAESLPEGKSAGDRLRQLAEGGARGLKIHAASDGLSPDSPLYKELLSVAAELKLPVILHTGCIHGALYRNRDYGDVRLFESWFALFPEITFVLAHTGFHEPEHALKIAAQFANVCVETSWQPAEIIAESVRRLGDDRVLFGTDWPLVGHNQSVGLARVQDAVSSGFMTQEQADKVLGLNTARVFNLSSKQESR